MEFESDKLLEPYDAYEKYYKDCFSKNAKELFQQLVEKSKIDVNENRRVAGDYRKSLDNTNSLNKKLSSQKALRILLIILSAVGALSAVLGFSAGNVWVIIISVLVCIASLVLIFAVINGKIKALKESFDSSDSQTKALYNKAMQLIAPLIDLFESSMTFSLIQKTVPTLVIDKNFDMRRYDYLNGKYGYGEDDGEYISTVGIMSGEIIGNPFVFERKIKHRWGTQLYTGSLTIHWTTYHNVNGKREAEHHTEVLRASVQKPKPFFSYITDLVYGNEAAPDLSFTREKTYADRFSSGKLKSFIHSRSKKIKKLARENMDKGFTELGNEEFDALFGAFDRNHEVQFRLLFTPLAQKNLLKLIKNKLPYGDDFNMSKNKCINTVVSDHAQNRSFTVDISQYISYDVDLCRDAFVKINAEYFESVYFDFAPLLSIPMYQQIKPHEYIYKEGYSRNYTVREAEVMANRIGFNVLSHPSSVTPAILKTELVAREKDVDKLSVHALSYRTVKRVDFIPVHGGDGRWHNVPVPWLLYIPLEQETQIELKALDMSERDYRYSPYANDNEKHIFYHSIFTTLGDISLSEDSAPGETDEDISEYGDITESSEITD